MKELVRVSTLSQAHSVRVALEAADIEAIVQGEELTGVLGNAFSVHVVRDLDFGKARTVRS